MKPNEIDLRTLQHIESASQQGLLGRWIQTCFKVWLERSNQEARAAKSTVAEHLQVFARLW